jgi:hypothetical protein
MIIFTSSVKVSDLISGRAYYLRSPLSGIFDGPSFRPVGPTARGEDQVFDFEKKLSTNFLYG